MSEITEYQLSATREHEHGAMQERAEEALALADKLYIESTADADLWEDRTKITYQNMKAFREYINDDIKNAKVPYDRLLEKRKAILGPMDQATALVTNKIGAFRKAYNEKIEREQQAKEADARRLEAELNQQNTLQAKKEADEKRQQLLNEAVRLSEAGEDVKAGEVLEQANKINPVTLAPVIVAPAPASAEKTKETSGATRYVVKITDMNKIPIERLRPPKNNKGWTEKVVTGIQKYVNSTGDTDIPGISTEEETSFRRG
jgi:hypothetical protein|tara:strand:- start:2433 stop:3215 length:783 start_codon:yes stop_codon:yes gene_type:complete